ncbi:hypothetical protein [Glycomyces harbinensis]|uniref:Uncharacterized protein n=1 Tax=Glycomyces harbinensis TaxID=58114 RepID=A0A1G7BNA8_9ACTN|nr:hypothetical protein [Glycomyces harbinensis]SDE28618.1 hypothetical protein SAMN05216270_11767 [Glycomyces harbinensis]
MVELLLAGVIIGAVATAAAVTGVRDRRRRRAERTGPRDAAPTSGEPIPSGWTAGRDGAER